LTLVVGVLRGVVPGLAVGVLLPGFAFRASLARGNRSLFGAFPGGLAPPGQDRAHPSAALGTPLNATPMGGFGGLRVVAEILHPRRLLLRRRLRPSLGGVAPAAPPRPRGRLAGLAGRGALVLALLMVLFAGRGAPRPGCPAIGQTGRDRLHG